MALNKLPWTWVAARGDPWPCGLVPAFQSCLHGPPLCPDESDYQTEYEEELLDGPRDAYADFQSAPADADPGSTSVSCPDTQGPWAELALRAPPCRPLGLPAA